MKKALIIGISGQDGSYLTELLLSKNYEVHGVIRRSSSFNTSRIDHLYLDLHEKPKLILHYGDITDGTRIAELVAKLRPDEIYNLAAQSHVKVSFDEPVYTVNADALGVLNILEAIRNHSPHSKFYQASSSEMFGKVQQIPQTEITPFYPRSPYGCAKLYGHWQTVNYRESYNIFACSGLLFNHESICGNSPVMIKKQGLIDIIPIEDMFKTEKHRYEGISSKYKDSEVWNGSEWTKIKNGTCYQDKNKKTRIIQTREASCETTFEHYIFKENDSDIPNEKLIVGDKLYKVTYPEKFETLLMDTDFSRFIGFICGDGYINEEGYIRLIGKDAKQLKYYASLITSKYGWTSRISEYISGFGSKVFQLDINNDSHWGKWLRSHLYTKYNSEKRVPKFILNGNTSTKKNFFDGYYDADGRKAGNEKYDIKGFTTSSATLCLGLIYLLKSFSSQSVKCKCEYRDNRRYFYVQLGSPSISNKGKHLIKTKNEIISITEAKSNDGWYFDIQTESETFATGPNLCKIHNSPRRGETFVTRKITRAATRIKEGLQNNLFLGNLDAKRDWGHARDYVEAMWLMLQQEKPDDYVVATGETHSVREFVELTFNYLNLDWNKYVFQDNKYLRPAEVDLLIGNAKKAENILKWTPKTSFKNLVEEMVKSDWELAKSEKYIKSIK